MKTRLSITLDEETSELLERASTMTSLSLALDENGGSCSGYHTRWLVQNAIRAVCQAIVKEGTGQLALPVEVEFTHGIAPNPNFGLGVQRWN